MMQLIFSPPSPFVRKVRVALIETGLDAQVELIPVAVTPVAPGDVVPARNPLGKIPCLIREDVGALYDSRVITRYIDALSGGRLYPNEPRLWEALTLEATADGILDAAVLMVYEGRVRPDEMVYEPWLDAQWLKVTRALDALEERWMPYLAGPVDMSVLSVAVALGYLDFRHADRDWRAGRPKLAEWEAEVLNRESLSQTIPEG